MTGLLIPVADRHIAESIQNAIGVRLPVVFVGFFLPLANFAYCSSQVHSSYASLAQLAEHALRKRMVMGSIPIGGCISQLWQAELAQVSRRLWRSGCAQVSHPPSHEFDPSCFHVGSTLADGFWAS